MVDPITMGNPITMVAPITMVDPITMVNPAAVEEPSALNVAKVSISGFFRKSRDVLKKSPDSNKDAYKGSS